MRAKTVVTIGVFDGVHSGHKRILEKAVAIARRAKAEAVAVTFNPHPLSVLCKKKAPPSLISLKHRLGLIRDAGIDRCVVIDFTKKFAGISAESFVKDILVKKLNAGWIVVGEGFCFGSKRRGDADFLARKGRELGFSVRTVRTLKYKGFAVSSSLIRRSIQAGRLGYSRELLGRPVTILGTVVKGNRLGEIIGFPTANVNPHHEVVPPSGVYAVRVRVRVDRKNYGGVLNIGTRPTFYPECSYSSKLNFGTPKYNPKSFYIRGGRCKWDKEPTIEVHIFDFSRRIYGKVIEVVFVKRIRSEKRFASTKELAEQIKKDVKQAKKILKEAICSPIFL